MSTKTTFKRVALVAVAALGLGVLTSVAPASAARTITGLSAGTATPARVGVTSSVTITATHVAASSDTFVAAAKVTTAPATSKTKTDTNTASLGVNLVTGSDTSIGAVTFGAGNAYATVTQASATATSSTFKLRFTPDVEGTYTVLVSTGSNTYTAGDQTVAVTFTTVGAPTSLTLAKVGGVVTTQSTSTYGANYKLTMKDANGNATVLGADETVLVSTGDATLATSVTSIAATGSVSSYTIIVYAASAVTAGSATLTVTGSGLLPATLTTNTTVSKVASSAAVTTDTVACKTAANCTSATGGTASDTTFTANVKGAVSLTIGGLSSLTTDVIYSVFVRDSSSGTAVDYATTVTLAATTVAAATTSTTFSAPAPSKLGTVQLSGFGDNVVTLSYVAPAQNAVSVASGNTAILSATAGKNTFTAKVVDQYTSAIANAAVSVTVSGRNTVATTVLGVTDANGLISYSLTDAGTTGTKDTVTFSITSGATQSAAAVITYGTFTVDTVTVSGGSKAETVAGSTLTAINAADNGPEASAVAIKAVVKDASGNLLAGVPVTFTVDKGAVVKTTSIDYAVVYTGADGSASTSVFNWVPGTQTITATAGGKSSTDYLTWGSAAASAARVLSISATGDIVTVKVVDRFGNPVKGVSVDLSRTGTGLFGNGSSTQTAVTDKNGTSDVRFSGTGTVVAELAATYTQAADIAGQIDATAVTAAVAGTTKGTGASLAPAGVAKVSIAIEESANSTLAASQSAADAAAEATDAANAATDAANAAAEAADAATAAAQDAADAVAALSTQVSEMVDALKKQITALTNLVIKIQKKVKA